MLPPLNVAVAVASGEASAELRFPPASFMLAAAQPTSDQSTMDLSAQYATQLQQLPVKLGAVRWYMQGHTSSFYY